MTKPDNGGMEKTRDYYRIAENTVDMLEAAAYAMDITVSVDGETAPMRAIPPLLYSIAYNLCSNAMKHDRRGGSVKATVTRNVRNTVLTAKDTGIGVPEEDVEA